MNSTATSHASSTKTAPIFDRLPHVQDHIVLRHVITESLLKARLANGIEGIDTLAFETVTRVLKAVHVQDTLLTEKQVVERWKFLGVKSLRNMRYKGTGPKYVKTGTHRNSRVFYKVCDIEAWIARHEELGALLSRR